uniref:Uncharacterized protein n=1 Tax=Moniliophthora roreri TaxID=221103 RepID=A0A0W0GEI3_MONRR
MSYGGVFLLLRGIGDVGYLNNVEASPAAGSDTPNLQSHVSNLVSDFLHRAQTMSTATPSN